MSRPCVWIIQEPNRVLVKGRRVGQLLTDGGFKPFYVGTVQAYILDAHRLADFAAWLDYRNVPFEVTTRGGAA